MKIIFVVMYAIHFMASSFKKKITNNNKTSNTHLLKLYFDICFTIESHYIYCFQLLIIFFLFSRKSYIKTIKEYVIFIF
jgi:hypothetical protein